MSNSQLLTEQLPLLIRSNGVGGLTTAANVRAYESLVIQVIQILEARARGSRIFAQQLDGGQPDPAGGLEGDLFVVIDTGDFFVFVDGRWGFLFNLNPAGGGGDATFVADFVVSLQNGGGFGKYANGATVPAAGKTAPEVLLDAYSQELFPGYANPTAALASSVAGPLEVGTTFAPTLTPGFTQNDAGALTSYALVRGATPLASDSAAPITFPAFVESFVLPLGTTTYTATFGYGQGPLKTGSAGSPAPGRIAAGSVAAAFSVATAYKLFFGPTAAAPTTSAAVRGLAQSQLATGNSGELHTGTAQNRFAIVLPPGKALTSVTDLDNLNANLLASYVAQAPLSVNDASGTPVAGFTPYVLTAATPYASSSRHAFTFA